MGVPFVPLEKALQLAADPKHHVAPSPLSVEDALAVIEDWLSQCAAVIPVATPRHIHILRGLLVEAGTAGTSSPTRTWRRWRSSKAQVLCHSIEISAVSAVSSS